MGGGKETMPQPAELEAVLGHAFRDPRYLELALTHSSLAYERASGRTDQSESSPAAEGEGSHDNEQFEFLGDAVLGLVAAEYLLHAYPDLNEGDLSRIRHQLISRKHLGKVGAQISLGSYLRLGRGEERSGGRQKPVLLANAVEALIAALYFDGGLKAAAAFIEQWIIHPYVDGLRSELDAGDAMGDHKSALQEWLQAHKAGSPHYTVKAETGPDHRKRFLVEVQVASATDEITKAQGIGSTKKKAEQEAARKVYQELRHPRPAVQPIDTNTARETKPGRREKRAV